MSASAHKTYPPRIAAITTITPSLFDQLPSEIHKRAARQLIEDGVLILVSDDEPEGIAIRA